MAEGKRLHGGSPMTDETGSTLAKDGVESNHDRRRVTKTRLVRVARTDIED